MRLLSAVHRWAGGLIGLLLALLGLTGALLVWEGAWIGVAGANDPIVENVGAMSAIAERAAAGGELSRITFASAETALHELTFRDGSGAYVRQDGNVVDTWRHPAERPELWLFDLHHHLLAGETGETITGVAGVAGILFVITGLILWWRSRRRFALRLLPGSFKPGPIVAHHRDLGAVTAPLLLLSSITGILMIFPTLDRALLGEPRRAPPVMDATAPSGPPVTAALAQAKARFPNAPLRRITLPAQAGKPVVVRLKQPFEWTPNGRTQLEFDSATGRLLKLEDPRGAGTAPSIREKLYPVHSAKVGGLLMKLLMTTSGVALFMLGGFATYAFWFRRVSRRRRPAPQLLTARS